MNEIIRTLNDLIAGHMLRLDQSKPPFQVREQMFEAALTAYFESMFEEINKKIVPKLEELEGTFKALLDLQEMELKKHKVVSETIIPPNMDPKNYE